MKDTDIQIDFLIDYISSYQSKIELSNSIGLFNNATLYELFAKKVCSLWFNRNFNNLNIGKFTYPYVDLVSEDNQLFVQVTSQANLPDKIELTLKKIRDSKKNICKNIKEVVFFALTNESCNKIKNFVGKNKIGNISFSKNKNLITTKMIIEKAKQDIDFQNNLYKFLKNETEKIKINSSALNDAIEASKNIGLANIPDSINNEYQIDRSSILEKIKADNFKNICLKGDAGLGKSVICKMLVENEKNVLYARAERFIEESTINNIWHFNIRETLKYLTGQNLIFFIDSLEFISDKPTKWDLLKELYYCTKDYSNVKIITSSRNIDINTLISASNQIEIYNITALSKDDMFLIKQKFPIINTLSKNKSYETLIKSPFYLNLIISKIKDLQNIENEHILRNQIWEEVICLKKKSKRYNIKFNEVAKTIEDIVVARAQNFLVGMPVEDYDTNIINALISEDVLIEIDNKLRLKYDIYEDICFEHIFDKLFEKSKNNFTAFYNELEAFGKCAYRRYQIWISNKLLDEENRNKFLNKIIFCENVPQELRRETLIGIVKSENGFPLFLDYSDKFIQIDLLNEIIDLINLYAFEFTPPDKNFINIQLRPIGSGRAGILNLVCEYGLYKTTPLLKSKLIKLCGDLTKLSNITEKDIINASNIIQFYIDENLGKVKSKQNGYKLTESTNELLSIVYCFAKYSTDWIIDLWYKLSTWYKSDNETISRFAEEVIEETLKSNHINLAKYCCDELCALAELFWTQDRKITYKTLPFMHSRDKNTKCYKYGLSTNAENYEHHSKNSLYTDNFFYSLFHYNFIKGLNWAITFINNRVDVYKNYGIASFNIYFSNKDKNKNYWGDGDMWMSGIQPYHTPLLISDLVYIIKSFCIDFIQDIKIDKKIKTQFAENLKNTLYEKSNNIILLTIISEIGLVCVEQLPGFALDLLTNIQLIYLDYNRYSLMTKNPTIEIIIKRMLLNIGLPNIEERYKYMNNTCLVDYMINSQLYEDENIKKYCYSIIDYLYHNIENTEKTGNDYLQIQKMDTRTYSSYKLTPEIKLLQPTFTGKAKDINKKAIENQKYDSITTQLINECFNKISKDDFNLKDDLHLIYEIIESSKKCIIKSSYDEHIVCLISYIFTRKDLQKDVRSNLCRILLEGVNGYFENKGFVIEKYEILTSLFAQVDMEIEDNLKSDIKKTMLKFLLYNESNGVIRMISHYITQYLSTNSLLAKTFMFTIIKIAEDEMCHQKYNAQYYNNLGNKDKIDFVPNMTPHLSGIDQIIVDNKANLFTYNTEDIINKYLINNEEIDLDNFNIEDYDLSLLINISKCGLSLKNDSLNKILTGIINLLVEIWSNGELRYEWTNIIEYNSIQNLEEYLKNAFLNDQEYNDLLDIMFDSVDSTKFEYNSIEFYNDIFFSITPRYFDAYQNNQQRLIYEKTIKALEHKISKLTDGYQKTELYKSLILAIPRFASSWTKCKTKFSIKDKSFINEQFIKYGEFCFDDMIVTVHQFHASELLPEILISLSQVFYKMFTKNRQRFIEIVYKRKFIIIEIISNAYINYNERIKSDEDLTMALENILKLLISIDIPESAVILDEFHIH